MDTDFFKGGARYSVSAVENFRTSGGQRTARPTYPRPSASIRDEKSAVKPSRANRVGHERRHQMVNRQPGLHPRPDLRRGYFNREAFQNPTAKWFRKFHHRFAGTRNDDKLRQPHQ